MLSPEFKEQARYYFDKKFLALEQKLAAIEKRLEKLESGQAGKEEISRLASSVDTLVKKDGQPVEKPEIGQSPGGISSRWD